MDRVTTQRIRRDRESEGAREIYSVSGSRFRQRRQGYRRAEGMVLSDHFYCHKVADCAHRTTSTAKRWDSRGDIFAISGPEYILNLVAVQAGSTGLGVVAMYGLVILG